MKKWVLGTAVLVVVLVSGVAGVGDAVGWFDDERRSGSVATNSADADAEEPTPTEDEDLETFCEAMWEFSTGEMDEPQQFADRVVRAGVPDDMALRARDGRELMIEIFHSARTMEDVGRRFANFDMRERASSDALFYYTNRVCGPEGEPREPDPNALDADPDY